VVVAGNAAAAAASAAAAAPLTPLPSHVIADGIELLCVDCTLLPCSATVHCLDCIPVVDFCASCSESMHGRRRFQAHRLERIVYLCLKQCGEQFPLHIDLTRHQTSCAVVAALAQDIAAAVAAAAAAAPAPAAAVAAADQPLADTHALDGAVDAAADDVHPQAAGLARSMRANPAAIMVSGRCSSCRNVTNIFCVVCTIQLCAECRIGHRQLYPHHAIEIVRRCPACLHVFLKYSELLLHDCVPRTKMLREQWHLPASSSLLVSSPCTLVPLIRLRGGGTCYVGIERIDDGCDEQIQMWLTRGQDRATEKHFVVKILKSKGSDDHEFRSAQQDVQRFAESLPSLSLNGFIQFVDAKV
jgi:hypothetical protein